MPRVVAVSPQMRLVEDNPASISLLDVYKQVMQCFVLTLVFLDFAHHKTLLQSLKIEPRCEKTGLRGF